MVGVNHGATAYMRLVTPELPDESNEATRRINEVLAEGYADGKFTEAAALPRWSSYTRTGFL